MSIALSILRTVHIACALLSLAVMFIPLAAKKGSQVHKRIGWVWVSLMAIGIATGLSLSMSYVVAPAVARPGQPVEAVRASGLFLSLLGLMSASSIWMGVRAIGRRASPQGSRHPVDIGLPALLFGLAGVVFFLGLSRASVPLSFFGLTAMFLGTQQLTFAARRLPAKMAWWYGHMNGMLAAVIASMTAFSVAGLSRLWALPASLRFVPWIAPTIILVPILASWVRYYRRRFEVA